MVYSLAVAQSRQAKTFKFFVLSQLSVPPNKLPHRFLVPPDEHLAKLDGGPDRAASHNTSKSKDSLLHIVFVTVLAVTQELHTTPFLALHYA